MSHFYNMRPKDVEQLPYHKFISLWRMITVIEAQKQLINITSSVFPNMEAKDRSKYIKDLEASAYVYKKSSEGKQKALSNKELADILKGRAR